MWPNPVNKVLDATDDYNIGIFGIAEPNTVFNDDLNTAINASIKKCFGNGFIRAKSCPGKHTGYNPGGIMQIIRGELAGRHKSSGTDKMGRYSWMTLRGRNDKTLCIITAYRVCQSKGTTPVSRESNTAHWQQVQAMIRYGAVAPDPRKQILTDLSRFIDERRNEGSETILMADANESITEKTQNGKNFSLQLPT